MAALNCIAGVVALQSPRARGAARCCASSAGDGGVANSVAAAPVTLSRRQSLALSAAALVVSRPGSALAAPAFEAGDGADVSAYLPEAPGQPGFVRFVPGPTKTPALRSGTIDPSAPYAFNLPKEGRWKEAKVANAISGNYCQPRCDEPTTEVIFQSGKQGKVSIVISPLTKVTRLVNPSVADIGTPQQLIVSFGPYITGDSIDAENDVVSASEQSEDGQTYYLYELFTPTALSGAHNVAALTFKGGVSLLCIASASEKQWDSAAEDLKAVVKSFRIGQKVV